MKLCKRILKQKFSCSTLYYNKETGYNHNINGPAAIYLDKEGIVKQFVYKINAKLKNVKKGPVYFARYNSWDYKFFYSAQWELRGLCVKFYYDDFSIRTIETYYINNRLRKLKTVRGYNKGVHFDNIKKELEIAEQWI